MILFMIWLIVAFVSLYPVQQRVLKVFLAEIGDEDAEAFDRIFSGFIALIICGIWPVTLGAFIVFRCSKFVWQEIQRKLK